MPTPDNSANIVVARQPLRNRKKALFGYELLFRSGEQNTFDPAVSDDVATSKLLTGALPPMGGHWTGWRN